MVNGCGTVGWTEIGKCNRKTRRKPAPVLLRSTEIPIDFTWDPTRAAEGGSRRLTPDLWHDSIVVPFSLISFLIFPILHLTSFPQNQKWKYTELWHCTLLCTVYSSMFHRMRWQQISVCFSRDADNETGQLTRKTKIIIRGKPPHINITGSIWQHAAMKQHACTTL
jgi:hypothetical protein